MQVVATYYVGCNPGRFDSPQYSQLAAELSGAHGPKVRFLTSLKNGVNNATCAAWAGLGGSSADEGPTVVDDASRGLHYAFFEKEHPAYAVVDHCMRLRARIGPSEWDSLRGNVTQLVSELDVE